MQDYSYCLLQRLFQSFYSTKLDWKDWERGARAGAPLLPMTSCVLFAGHTVAIPCPESCPRVNYRAGDWGRGSYSYITYVVREIFSFQNVTSKLFHLPTFTGIGKYGGQGRLAGYIDELYIYNRTLPEPELKALIQKCQGPKSTMILHLSFDKKSGTKFLDDSGLLNHAEVGGPPLQPGQPTPAPPPRKYGSYMSWQPK